MLNFSHISINRENAFTWAFLISISLHLLAAIGIPTFSFEKMEKPKVLVIELTQPNPAPPQEIPKPPEPIKPKVTPPIKPIPQDLPKPVITKSPEAVLPPPPVATPTPKIEAPAPVVAQAPVVEPQKPSVSQVDVDNARNQYGNLLSREVAKHKQYPKIAQMRGWQGDVELDLQIDGSGNLLSAKIRTPSGFEALDKQALEMAKKAAPFPLPPEALRGKVFNVIIPVSFRLE